MTREGGGSSYSSHMRGVALSLLVMGLSLVTIIIAYESFGHVGPKFSADLLVKQQASAKEAIWFTSNACYYERLPVTCSSVVEEYYPKQAIVIMSNMEYTSQSYVTLIGNFDRCYIPTAVITFQFVRITYRV